YTSADQLQNTAFSPPSPPILGGTGFSKSPRIGGFRGREKREPFRREGGEVPQSRVSEEQAQAATEQLKQTAIAQSALFVIEYALAQLWMAWGVHPVAAIGHSIGEYVAACLAGVFSLEEALFIVAIRGQLMQQLPTGAMLSVSLSSSEVQPLLGEELSLAASNAPSLCVVSGTTDAIATLQARLTAQGVDCRRLHTSHAFHSQMMDPIVESFKEQLINVTLKPPQIPFVSNVTGTWITAEEATNPSYWARHLRETVRFNQGITELLQQPERVLLEVGPGRTLSTFAKRHPGSEQVVLTSMRHPNEKHSDMAFLLNALGRLWLAGVPVEWSGFYAHEQRHRIPLPTYPFERQRYWIEPQSKADNAAHQLTKKPNIADWFYIPSWKRSLLPGQVQLASNAEKTSCWLVFSDAVGLGEKIIKRLELDGHDVITVTVGEQFTQLSRSAYTINPQQRDDYDCLLKALQALDLTPNAIAHLWSLTPNESAQSQNQFFEDCQNLGFYSLLFLAQALGKQEIANPLEILVVTNNIQDVYGDERLCPEKATVLGMCKVIGQEYPNIICRSIDVEIPKSGTETQLINQLLGEFTLGVAENVVAYRGKHRWVQTFEPVQIDEVSKEKIPLREGGVYLITGGLSGIGLVLAEYLARTVRAKLILIGRKDVNPQSPNPKLLEAFGAEVLVASADIANKEQMQNAIALATKRFGTIHGVIHAAGVRSVNTVQAISRAECEKQFQAKVQGLFVLEEVLQGIDLDFCLLMSSLASILGLLGKAAYPAANIFMDAFAHKHNQSHPSRWISVNWDNWLTEETLEFSTRPNTLQWYMTPQEGVEAFQRILSMGAFTQVVVSTGDLQARLDQWTQPKPTENSQKVDLLSLHSRPNLHSTYIAPRNPVEQTFAEIWEQLLGIEQVGIHDNFFDLGGDSVLGIQLIAKANQAGFQLSTRQVFECQTIAELAAVAGIRSKQVQQDIVTGSLSLTPIQHWFFEQNQPEPHHWNQAVWLEVQQAVDPVLLEQALRQLLIHHDALRLRFTHSESSWQQVNASPDTIVPFTRLDLSAVSPEAQIPALKAAATELHATLNLSEGPIVRVAFFDRGATLSSYLLISIHHLAVDVVSWRILLQDFQTAYQQLVEGQAIQLPPKTTSFKQWAEQLKQYAHSAEVRRELDYWLGAFCDRLSPLPVDYPEGANTVASAQTVSVALSVEETQVLLQQVPAVYRTQTDEVLLAAMVQAFARWTGVSSLLIDLERSGRDVIFNDVDLSRTIGWFTTLFPALLSLGEDANHPGEALKALKEQLRRIPSEGIGYGVLRYLSEDATLTEKLGTLPPAEVVFLYLGQFEESLPQSSLFKLTREFSGSERSLRGIRPHLLQVTGLIDRGQLQVSWTYSENVHRRTTVERLAQNFVEALRLLLTHCQSPEAGGYTPSDFSAAKISQTDLSKLLAQAKQFGG
ncbi:MAG: SDR family NAD(P)-dependent oxidoreductase, partial [Microcoleus sp. SIO2G3]|nr:SDR family NAD(P)-dependent oxidoreductase [Microcoleus sp. SIO2G3]